MARKQLIKGPNAQRVEKRIAKIPEDLSEGNIFRLLKEEEEKDAKTGEGTQTLIKRKTPGAKKKAINLTKSEREIIVKSCTAYKHSLPIYLRYVQDELKIVDAIIKKLT